MRFDSQWLNALVVVGSLTLEVRQEVVTCKFGGLEATIAIEDANHSAQCLQRLNTALIVERFVGLYDSNGEVASVTVHMVVAYNGSF